MQAANPWQGEGRYFQSFNSLNLVIFKLEVSKVQNYLFHSAGLDKFSGAEIYWKFLNNGHFTKIIFY